MQGGQRLRRRRGELLRRLRRCDVSYRHHDHHADRHDGAPNDDDARAYEHDQHDHGDVRSERKDLYDQRAVLLPVLLPGHVLLTREPS